MFCAIPNSVKLLAGTVKERLSSYTSRAEFERHVRLVFSNAMEYNNEGDEIWSAAQAMSDFFDSLWRASAGGSTAPEGGADDSEAQMGRAPTVRKPGRRKSAPQQAAQPSPRGDVRGNESPPPSEERGRGREQSRGGAGAPRDYTKAVREGGWKAGALEVRARLCLVRARRSALIVYLLVRHFGGCR